jgi:hypothetical protein
MALNLALLAIGFSLISGGEAMIGFLVKILINFWAAIFLKKCLTILSSPE